MKIDGLKRLVDAETIFSLLAIIKTVRETLQQCTASLSVDHGESCGALSLRLNPLNQASFQNI